jgi:hypothetical protein
MKESILKLKTLLTSELAGRIKYFYIGDPYLIPESALPCIMIEPTQTETDIADNSRDIHHHNISITLLIDAKQYFNKMPEEMVGFSALMEMMEEENTDGTISQNSILGILRANLTLDDNRFVSNISTIDYTIRQRAEQLITLETTLNLVVDYISPR